MMDSSRSYRRKRRYSALDKRRYSALEIISIIGVVATVIGAVAGVIEIFPMSSKGSRDAERPQPSSASAVAPSVRNGAVVIKKNTTFSLTPGQGVLLQRDRGEDAFALSELPSGRAGPGLIRVFLKGKQHDIALGETVATSDSGCFVWIISEAGIMEELTKSALWIFEYHCNR